MSIDSSIGAVLGAGTTITGSAVAADKLASTSELANTGVSAGVGVAVGLSIILSAVTIFYAKTPSRDIQQKS